MKISDETNWHHANRFIAFSLLALIMFHNSFDLTLLVTPLDGFSLIVLMFTSCYPNQNFGKAIFEINFQRNNCDSFILSNLSQLTNLLL